MSTTFDERDRASVCRDLESSDAEVRRLAVERVDALPHDEVLPRLVDRLGDEDWRVRKATVERLLAQPDTDRVARALLAALADGDNPGRRNSAVEALIHFGEPMVPHLVEATHVDDVDVRKFAVDALAGIPHHGAVDALVERLGDPDTNVRAAAADALGSHGGDAACTALESTATDAAQDPLVRFSALHALAALEVPLRARRLASVLDDAVLRPAGLALLGWVADDEEAAEILLKGLTSGARASREAAARSLLRLLGRLDGARGENLVRRVRESAAAAPDLVEGCIERLESADLPTRLVLVQLLGLVGEPAAVLPILSAGRDEALAQVAIATLEAMGDVAEQALEEAWAGLDAEAQRDACTVLGQTRGERGALRLVGCLDARDPEIRTAAARSIGERGFGEAVTPLVHRLEQAALDEDLEGEEERVAIAEALIALAREGAAPEVAARTIEQLCALLDGPESVRLAVATVLGRIGRREDTEALTLLLKDASEKVRRAAVEALARLEPGTVAEPLRLAVADESPAVRVAAAGALGASNNPEVFADLCRLADDEDARVRATAVRTLVSRFATDAGSDCADAVREVLDAAREDEPLVALAAIDAVTGVGGACVAHVVPMLQRAEPEVVREAVRCLGAHGSDVELESAIPLVSHPDWSVRAEAIHVLAERGLRRAVPAILRRLETEQDDFVRGETLRALQRLEG